MKIGLMLTPYPNERWTLAKQLGVTHAISRIPREQAAPPWDFMSLLLLKKSFDDAGLTLACLEGDQIPMERIKLGLPGRDEDIEHFCQVLINMGKVGIPMLCYNFMAQFGWMRTSVTTRTRGGALVTSFDNDLVQEAPLTEAGLVTDERLWDNLIFFLQRVVPVAEKARVKLALHPDDPPISPIRGVARIIRSVDAFKRVIETVPSDYNGITFCQANSSAMGADVLETARYFAGRKKIFFIHFRNIIGDNAKFVETFHDEGQINMYEAMKCYLELGFDGLIRPDHAPTMEGEVNNVPGYEMLGRIFAVGYMKGLIEAISSTR
ncbi:MAG: mannonate dehydratase [Bacteroidota bacterium]